MTDFLLSGTYRQCPACRAPLVSPAPENSSIDLVKEGPPLGPVSTFFTPHRATCSVPPVVPDPGHTIRVPIMEGMSATWALDVPTPT